MNHRLAPIPTMHGSASPLPGTQARKARFALSCLNMLFIATLTLVWSTIPTRQAFAYVDPSVMTYTIQALAGVAVALSALAGVLFRRTRRKLFALFNVDENRNKIDEDAVIRIDPHSPSAQEQLDKARLVALSLNKRAAEASDKHSARDMKWRTRFAFALVICLFTFFIVLVAPALEIFGANTDSLVFSMQAIWWIPALFCALGATCLAALLSLLKRKPFYTSVLLVFLIGIAAYVQSAFLNQGMMPADGGFIGWNEPFFVSKMWFSGIVWALIIAVPLVLSRHYQHTWLKGACAMACALIIMQSVGVASVAIDSGKNAAHEQGKPYVTQSNLLTVAPQNNVVEFVLDTYDTAILDQIISEDPDYLQGFEDFTYFHNSTGTMIPTSNAIPNMLTQNKPKPNQDLAEYRQRKYEDATFLNDISEAGFSIGIYTDSLMTDFSSEADKRMATQTLNVHPVSQAPIDIGKTFIVTMQCALYREAPWVLKPLFWYYTSDLNNRMIADAANDNLDDSLYELDDAAILDMVMQHGLNIDEQQSGAYRFIHLFGPHFPFSINENGEEIGTNQSDQVSQAKGSMRVVMEYMNQLKSLGLYDETTIIITADHGVWNITDDPVKNAISPIILVKPSFEDLEADGEHLRREAIVSEMPVCHDDLQPTVMAALGLDAQKYGTTVFQVDDTTRVRYFDATTSAGNEGERFVEYAIAGDALELGNWEKTGNVWRGA